MINPFGIKFLGFQISLSSFNSLPRWYLHYKKHVISVTSWYKEKGRDQVLKCVWHLLDSLSYPWHSGLYRFLPEVMTSDIRLDLFPSVLLTFDGKVSNWQDPWSVLLLPGQGVMSSCWPDLHVVEMMLQTPSRVSCNSHQLSTIRLLSLYTRNPFWQPTQTKSQVSFASSLRSMWAILGPNQALWEIWIVQEGST